jgi:hypothetical protein
MRKRDAIWIAVGMLLVLGQTAGAVPPDGTTFPAPPGPAGDEGPGPAAGNGQAGAAVAISKQSILDVYIKTAKQNGYESSVLGQPGDDLFVLKLTRLGKTQNGYGILQKKWDEKDVIDLTFGKAGKGVALEEVKRDVMVKPPFGDWIKQPTADVPTWVLAPSPTNG